MRQVAANQHAIECLAGHRCNDNRHNRVSLQIVTAFQRLISGMEQLAGGQRGTA